MLFKNLFYLSIFLIFFNFLFFKIKNRILKKKFGKIIILNGPSASGKSSIQKDFQNLMMPNLWIKLGIDNLFDKPMPDITIENLEFWKEKNSIRWVEEEKDKNKFKVIKLFVGENGKNVVYGMNSAIKEYAKNGCNVIVDYIVYEKDWIDDLKNKINEYDFLWIKINIPIKVLEERELLRGTSPVGHARSHYENVYWDIKYDFEVDTSLNSSIEAAKKIKEFFEIKF